MIFRWSAHGGRIVCSGVNSTFTKGSAGASPVSRSNICMAAFPVGRTAYPPTPTTTQHDGQEQNHELPALRRVDRHLRQPVARPERQTAQIHLRQPASVRDHLRRSFHRVSR